MGITACTEPQCLYKGDLYLYLPISELLFRSIKGRLLGSVSGVMVEKVGFVLLGDLNTKQIFF